jgi:hypothetical protein
MRFFASATMPPDELAEKRRRRSAITRHGCFTEGIHRIRLAGCRGSKGHPSSATSGRKPCVSTNRLVESRTVPTAANRCPAQSSPCGKCEHRLQSSGLQRSERRKLSRKAFSGVGSVCAKVSASAAARQNNACTTRTCRASSPALDRRPDQATSRRCQQILARSIYEPLQRCHECPLVSGLFQF